MSNVDAPRGFRAIRGDYNAAPKLETYGVTAAIEIGEGQPVCIAATGLVVSYTDALALAGNILGVAAHYVAAAAVDRELQVYTDPNQLYEIQFDDNTVTDIAGCVGALFDIVNPTTINTTLQTSSAEADHTAAVNIGATAGDLKPIRCEGLSKNMQNDRLTTWTRIVVRFVGPVHHRGMGAVGFGTLAGTTFKGI